MLRFTNKNRLAIKVSHEKTHLLAKRMKPFSDVEFMKKFHGNNYKYFVL